MCLPCAILCLISLSDKQASSLIDNGNHTGGEYAVVRSLRDGDPIRMQPSLIVQRGLVEKKYYVYSCSSIRAPVAVVQQEGKDKENDFFVIRNKKYWLQCFHDLLHDTDSPS